MLRRRYVSFHFGELMFSCVCATEFPVRSTHFVHAMGDYNFGIVHMDKRRWCAFRNRILIVIVLLYALYVVRFQSSNNSSTTFAGILFMCFMHNIWTARGNGKYDGKRKLPFLSAVLFHNICHHHHRHPHILSTYERAPFVKSWTEFNAIDDDAKGTAQQIV